MNELNSKMELILIPFGNEFLALPQESFKEALELGRQISEGVTARSESFDSQERLLDAEEMSKLTNPPIPSSWFSEKARRNEIPSISFGKYVRFRPSDVFKVLERDRVRR